MAGIDRFIPTKADGVHAVGIYAHFDERLPDSAGSALTEGAVIFICAALVAVPFNPYGVGGIRLKIICHDRDFGFVSGLDYGAVIFKVNRIGTKSLTIFWPTLMRSGGGCDTSWRISPRCAIGGFSSAGS